MADASPALGNTLGRPRVGCGAEIGPESRLFELCLHPVVPDPVELGLLAPHQRLHSLRKGLVGGSKLPRPLADVRAESQASKLSGDLLVLRAKKVALLPARGLVEPGDESVPFPASENDLLLVGAVDLVCRAPKVVGSRALRQLHSGLLGPALVLIVLSVAFFVVFFVILILVIIIVLVFFVVLILIFLVLVVLLIVVISSAAPSVLQPLCPVNAGDLGIQAVEDGLGGRIRSEAVGVSRESGFQFGDGALDPGRARSRRRARGAPRRQRCVSTRRGLHLETSARKPQIASKDSNEVADMTPASPFARRGRTRAEQRGKTQSNGSER